MPVISFLSQADGDFVGRALPHQFEAQWPTMDSDVQMDASGMLYPGAGLVAYVEAHPLPMNNMDELLAGLRDTGFAAEEARDEMIGITYTEVMITLRLPNAPGAEGELALWRLGGYAGNWHVLPPASDDGASEWPRVGGFSTPKLAPAYVTP